MTLLITLSIFFISSLLIVLMGSRYRAGFFGNQGFSQIFIENVSLLVRIIANRKNNSTSISEFISLFFILTMALTGINLLSHQDVSPKREYVTFFLFGISIFYLIFINGQKIKEMMDSRLTISVQSLVVTYLSVVIIQKQFFINNALDMAINTIIFLAIGNLWFNETLGSLHKGTELGNLVASMAWIAHFYFLFLAVEGYIFNIFPSSVYSSSVSGFLTMSFLYMLLKKQRFQRLLYPKNLSGTYIFILSCLGFKLCSILI